MIMKSYLHHLLAGLRIMALLTVILGALYPLAIWGIGHVLAPGKAEGSIVTANGREVGSRLIGQQFTGKEWLWGRPSAADYDGRASGSSNLGPNSPELLKTVTGLKEIRGAKAPADALTTSGSGLDPHISTTWAQQQVDRIAKARGVETGRVQQCIDEATRGRRLGFLGERTVNVLEANICLSALGK